MAKALSSQTQNVLILAALNIAALLAIAFAFPRFATGSNLAGLVDDTAILVILALGQMAVLVTRSVDLSVASIVAASGMAAAMVNVAFPQLGPAVPIAAAISCGLALGLINALVVWALKVPPIVATLAAMAIFRGGVFVISGGNWINSAELSSGFITLPTITFLGATLLSWLAIAIVLAMTVFFTYTRSGRRLFAVGSQPSAAIYAGLSVGQSQGLAFLISGGLGGLCGYLWVARFGVAYTDLAQGFELQTIAACVVGGVSINGGSGAVAGVVLGALFLGLIKNALPLVEVSPFWQTCISGLIIVVAAMARARHRAPRARILAAQ